MKRENQDDREKIKSVKLALAELIYQSKKMILQGKLTEAHDRLFKFITEKKDSLGQEDSVFMLPGLFAIAQIHIIEGRLNKAHEYLTGAHWNLLKYTDKASQVDKKPKDKITIQLTSEEKTDYQISLHHSFAKLYEAKEDYKQAINQLKKSTYLQCCKWGPEHPCVALNYFLLGKNFIDLDLKSQGQGFFAKVSQIWYHYLKNFFRKSQKQQESYLVSDLTLEEALNYLAFIERYFQQVYEEQQAAVVFTPVMRTYYCIGFLYKIFDNNDQCQMYLKQVYRRCLKHLPPYDVKTQKIRSTLMSMNVNFQEIDRNPDQPILMSRPTTNQDQIDQNQQLEQQGDDTQDQSPDHQ